MAEFSEYIVYVDESGDHGMETIDPEFPVFALAFCLMRKADYMAQVVPAVQGFKFKYWGHDAIVLHEREIRKSTGPFSILKSGPELRKAFFSDLNGLIEAAPMELFASVIDKGRHRAKYANPWNPYEVALLFCLERLLRVLLDRGQEGKTVHVVFEGRGRREDDELVAEFERVCRNLSNWGYRSPDFTRINFKPVIMSKAANSAGLQLADLVARPIALRLLRPGQPNRAYDIIHPKLEGLKHFP